MVKLNTGPKLAASLDLAQTETSGSARQFLSFSLFVFVALAIGRYRTSKTRFVPPAKLRAGASPFSWGARAFCPLRPACCRTAFLCASQKHHVLLSQKPGLGVRGSMPRTTGKMPARPG